MNSPQAFQGKRKISTNSGLTLIEILVVMGIIVFVIAFASLVDVNYYRRELSASEISILVSSLQKARSRSMNNIDATAHGVYLGDTDHYILFQGTSFSPSDPDNENVPRNPNLTLTGDFDEVYFEQLSGEPSDTGDLSLSDGTSTKIISLSSGGLINW